MVRFEHNAEAVRLGDTAELREEPLQESGAPLKELPRPWWVDDFIAIELILRKGLGRG